MKTFISALFLFFYISSQAASVKICANFQTIGLRQDCVKAIKTNRTASDYSIYNCATFATIGIQKSCLEAVQFTPSISANDIADCQTFNTVGGQMDCLTSLCPEHGIFGGCK